MNNQKPIVDLHHGHVAAQPPVLEVTADAKDPAAESAVMQLTSADATDRNFHSAVLANLAEGVHLTRTRDGIIVYTNSRFDSMLGYGPGELIGRSVAMLNAPLSDKSPRDIAEEIISTLH